MGNSGLTTVSSFSLQKGIKANTSITADQNDIIK